jgi:histidyl-tRNA synthetase
MSLDNTLLGPPRGMRDFYPEDMAIRNTLFDVWRASALKYGFSHYDSCVVESLDLLKRKAGEEITDQIYAFTDKSGRELALRPEMTPTLARMIASRQASLSFPLKWFTIAQCFRYERMTRGRKREHYQWNLDIVGEASVTAEAEVLATAIDALQTLGLGKDKFRVHFNSRALLSDLLLALDIEKPHHPAAFQALDKRGKMDDDEIAGLLAKAGIDSESVKKIFTLLGIPSLEEAEKLLGGNKSSLDSIRQFVEMLNAYGISELVTFDISVVRGLSYYTGIVFEAFDINRKFRAIFGGGRYDNLLNDIGGTPATGVGLGFGDVVIAEILAEINKIPAQSAVVQLAVGYMTDEQRPLAISLATALRSKGRPVDLALHAEKAKNFFARAGKSCFQQAIYVGPDDVARGAVRIKDLGTRQEIETSIAEITQT